MSLKVDIKQAKLVCLEAIEWANDKTREVPQYWVDATRKIANGRSKTFTAGLGLALLAKATNPSIDSLSIKPEDDRPNSFAIRNLAKPLLVPLSRGGPHPPFHLGATKSEPMNNQPYFRYSDLREVDRTGDRETLNELISTLEYLEGVEDPGSEALAALAAFIRERTLVAARERETKASIRLADQDFPQLIFSLQRFLDSRRPETKDLPLRLQAVCGGLIRCSGVTTSSQGINDPSRHAPGDVHAPSEFDADWVAEVKNRGISQLEAIDFLENVADRRSISIAWIVVNHAEHQPLDREALYQFGYRHSLVVTITESLEELVSVTLGHPKPEIESITGATKAVGKQLEDIGASTNTIKDWADCTKRFADPKLL